MDVPETISTLRAVRSFDGRPLSEGVLAAILEAGRRAPSSMNEQRWAFVVCTDRDHLRELATIGDYAGHIAGAAAAIALVTPEAEEDWRRESIAFDLGQCAENMMIAAWSMGIGSVHAAVYDERRARDLLAYPAGWRCDYVLSLGHPTRVPTTRGGRKPLSELTHRERWGA
jgi:nitroreductase